MKNNFSEVNPGLSRKEAAAEARRCIQCRKPFCIAGCPVGIDIPAFILRAAVGDFSGALRIIKNNNNLPAVCGRVCPQENQCEKVCILGKKQKPVNIGLLERAAADYGLKKIKEGATFTKRKKKGQPIAAVVGSGPAGLTCAADLARAGFKVTVFEALHEPGGVLRYGIPPFRLPREILETEIENIRMLGVEFVLNTVIGKTLTIKDLFNRGYKAVFIGTGAGLPVMPEIPGINLCGIYSANEFLMRINLMGAGRFPEYDTPLSIGKRVVVIGGGNTAMDAARSALRIIRNGVRYSAFGERGGKCGVTVLYRRTENEMPARAEEIKHAIEEGVRIIYLAQPVEFAGENGFVKSVKCIKCRLSGRDAKGRPAPVPVSGTEFSTAADTVIIAVGLRPNKLLTSLIPGLKMRPDGGILVNPQSMETSIRNIYAGGDIVGGEATVIEAMGMGKKAARTIILKYIYPSLEKRG